jgi:hypothetical protein
LIAAKAQIDANGGIIPVPGASDPIASCDRGPTSKNEARVHVRVPNNFRRNCARRRRRRGVNGLKSPIEAALRSTLKDLLRCESDGALGDGRGSVMENKRMEGNRRIDSLEADVERLRRELERIDREILHLAGKNGHSRDGGVGSEAPNKEQR